MIKENAFCTKLAFNYRYLYCFFTFFWFFGICPKNKSVVFFFLDHRPMKTCSELSVCQCTL